MKGDSDETGSTSGGEGVPPAASSQHDIENVTKKVNRRDEISFERELQEGVYRIEVTNKDMIPRVVIPAVWGMSLKNREGRNMKTISERKVGSNGSGPLISAQNTSPVSVVDFKVKKEEAPAVIAVNVTGKIIVGSVLFNVRLTKLEELGEPVAESQASLSTGSSPAFTPSSPTPSMEIPRNSLDDSNKPSPVTPQSHPQNMSTSPNDRKSSLKNLNIFKRKDKKGKDDGETSTKEHRDRADSQSSQVSHNSEGEVGIMEEVWTASIKLPKGESRERVISDLKEGTYKLVVVSEDEMNALKRHLSDVTVKLTLALDNAEGTVVKTYKTTKGLGMQYLFRVPKSTTESGQLVTCKAQLVFKSQALLLSQNFRVELHQLPSNVQVTTDDDVTHFEMAFKIASALLVLCMFKLVLDILSITLFYLPLYLFSIPITVHLVITSLVGAWFFVNFAEAKNLAMVKAKKFKKFQKDMKEMKRLKDLKKAANKGSGLMDKFKQIKGAVVAIQEDVNDEKDLEVDTPSD